MRFRALEGTRQYINQEIAYVFNSIMEQTVTFYETT